MKNCLTSARVSKYDPKHGAPMPVTRRNYVKIRGMSRAFSFEYMVPKLKCFMTLVALAVPVVAFAAGGSDGGTNVEKVSKEPIEFFRAGQLERINPRAYRGIYSDLVARIRNIESKIPGLGKELEEVLDQRSWFLTDREFPARNPSEEQPIYQNETHVYLTKAKTDAMSHEQLKKAWLHEMVRRLIQDGKPALKKPLDQAQIDDLVERLTVVLYTEYDMPDVKLAKFINDVLGFVTFGNDSLGNSYMGYLARSEINERIRRFDLKKKYAGVCEANNVYLSQKYHFYKNERCFWEGGSLNKKSDDELRAFLQRCMDPSVQNNVLASLNLTRDKGVEDNNHYRSEPFRTYFKKEYDDGKDIYEHPPANKYGTLDSPWGISLTENLITPAIAGKTVAQNGDETILPDATRIWMATQACEMATIQPEQIAAIKNSEVAPRPTAVYSEAQSPGASGDAK